MGERVPSAYGGTRLPRRRVACLSLILDRAGVVVAETCESAKSAGWAGSSHREARGLSPYGKVFRNELTMLDCVPKLNELLTAFQPLALHRSKASNVEWLEFMSGMSREKVEVRVL